MDFSRVFVDLIIKIRNESATQSPERTIDPADHRPECSFCDGRRENQLPEFESGEGPLVLGEDTMEKTRAAPGSAQYENRSSDLDIAIAPKENVIEKKRYPVQDLNEEERRDEHRHLDESLDCDASTAAVAVRQR